MLFSSLNRKPALQDQLILILVGALLFVPYLGGVRLFDWDEINFAEAAREMIVLGDYSRVHINYELFWEKPPLFFWMQAGAMQVFGVGEFAARLPNAIAGILTLLLVYRLGTRLLDRRFGWFWALSWMGSLLPHLYARSGIIDPWFNLFIFLSLLGVIRFVLRSEDPNKSLRSADGLGVVISGVFAGLAVLSKGPVALLLIGLCLVGYALWQWRIRTSWWVGALVWLGFAVLTCALWFVPDLLRNGSWFTTEFLRYQVRLFQTEDAGHGGFPGYHLVVLLLGCFPASVLALQALSKPMDMDRRFLAFRQWMILVLFVVVVLFSVVQSKIVHYSSLAYYPVTFLSASGLYALSSGSLKKVKWLCWGIISITFIMLLALGAVLLVLSMPERFAESIADPFARAQLLCSPTWNGADALPILALAMIVGGGVWMLQKRKPGGFALALFGGVALFIELALYTYMGRAEAIAQGPMMRWYESLSGQPVYVYSRFRSYAPYFYFRPPPPPADVRRGAVDRAREDQQANAQHRLGRRPEQQPSWLLYSDSLDRDVYIVAKIQQAEALQAIEGVETMEQDGGYVLLRRQAVLPAASATPQGE